MEVFRDASWPSTESPSRSGTAHDSSGGAVGFSRVRGLGSGSSRRMIGTLGAVWEAYRRATRMCRTTTDDAGFMLFDTVLAFDHVKHRILDHHQRPLLRLKAPNLRESQYDLAQAKIRFLEQELDRAAVMRAARVDPDSTLRWRVEHDPSKRDTRKPPSDGGKSTSAPATFIRWCCHSASKPTSPWIPSRCIVRFATSTRRPTCTSSEVWTDCALPAHLPRCWCASKTGRCRDASDRRHPPARTLRMAQDEATGRGAQGE